MITMACNQAVQLTYNYQYTNSWKLIIIIPFLDTLKVGQGRFSVMMIMVAPVAYTLKLRHRNY